MVECIATVTKLCEHYGISGFYFVKGRGGGGGGHMQRISK